MNDNGEATRPDDGYQATTSAALKLLRLRRIGLKPGLSDLEPGTTIAFVLWVIQPSPVVPFKFSVAAFATSLSELAELCCGR
jgi:hypothetical protein